MMVVISDFQHDFILYCMETRGNILMHNYARVRKNIMCEHFLDGRAQVEKITPCRFFYNNTTIVSSIVYFTDTIHTNHLYQTTRYGIEFHALKPYNV